MEGYDSASLLDDIAPDNPVYLTHKSLHPGWLNSTALHLAGITRNTPQLAGAMIGHLQNGEPDGILFESATGLLERVLPEPSHEQVVNALQKAIPLL